MWNTFLELSKAQLRQIAWRQRAAIFCILLHMVLYGAAFLGGLGPALIDRPESVSVLVKVLMAIGLAIMAAFTVLVCMLGAIVLGPAGFLLGLATVLPAVGIFALLTISTRTTSLLQMYGVRVGFFGANREDLSSL